MYTLMTPIFPSLFEALKLEMGRQGTSRISNVRTLENHVVETLQQSQARDTQRREVTCEDTNS
jgi:hypothetical protein